jgi:hypothetical protein
MTMDPIRVLLEFYSAEEPPEGDYDVLMYFADGELMLGSYQLGAMLGSYQLGAWFDYLGYQLDVTPAFWARLPEDSIFPRGME